MGQSINVLLYGCRVPEGVDTEALCAAWAKHVAPKVEAYEKRLSRRTHLSWSLAKQAFEPREPRPDDATPDKLIGFFVCRGYHDHAENHAFPAMSFAEMRRTSPNAAIIKRCRRRWSRFARWARACGVEFGKPRIWRTRTEVA